MARKSKNRSKKSSWKRNLLWFLGITALFTGLGVAGGAALGTVIPFLGTVGGILLFGSIGFGLAMIVGACAAVKGIKNWLTKPKSDIEQTNHVDNLTTVQDSHRYKTIKRVEQKKEKNLFDTFIDVFQRDKKTNVSGISPSIDSINSKKINSIGHRK